MGQAAGAGHGNTRPEEKTFNVAAFLKAARDGNLNKLIYCLGCHGSDVNATNQMSLTALHLACKAGHTDIIRYLVRNNADPNICTKRGNTPLHIAAIHGQKESICILVDSGANINSTCNHGYTPLYLAVMENHFDAVEVLLALGANRNLGPKKSMTPLKVAQIQEQDLIISLLKRTIQVKRSRENLSDVASGSETR